MGWLQARSNSSPQCGRRSPGTGGSVGNWSAAPPAAQWIGRTRSREKWRGRSFRVRREWEVTPVRTAQRSGGAVPFSACSATSSTAPSLGVQPAACLFCLVDASAQRLQLGSVPWARQCGPESLSLGWPESWGSRCFSQVRLAGLQGFYSSRKFNLVAPLSYLLSPALPPAAQLSLLHALSSLTYRYAWLAALNTSRSQSPCSARLFSFSIHSLLFAGAFCIGQVAGIASLPCLVSFRSLYFSEASSALKEFATS